MVVRMRHTSGHTRNRRAHHKLTNPRLSSDSGMPHMRHRASAAGTYRGRVVIDTVKIAEKKAARAKVKAKSRGEAANSGENRSPEAAPLETTTEKKPSKKKAK